MIIFIISNNINIRKYKMKNISTKYTLLATSILCVMSSNLYANEAVTELETIEVTATAEEKKQLAQTVTTHQDIAKEQINNSHDLVRYNTEVDVAEVGRYGNKGFAIRGVDGNRVAMNIDGVALPEVEVNEIFSPYGYMYEGRFNPELEMMESVSITAGADSLASGSGAVGGSIAYKTKEPANLLLDGQKVGGYAKAGYASKNEEIQRAVGLAGAWDRFEFLLNYSQKTGHETKNHAMRKADKDQLAIGYTFTEEEIPGRLKSLIYPNPMQFKRESALAKLYWNITDQHRLGVHGLRQEQDTHMNTDINASFGSRTSVDSRRAKDKELLKGYGVNYRYQANLPFLDKVELNYTHNEVLGVADTWIYDRPWFGTDFTFDRREYRPTETKTEQYNLTAKTPFIDFGALGNHEFTLSGNVVKSDRSTSATVLKEDGSPNYLNYTFSDVRKNNFNISLIDKIDFSDRLKAMLGVRYDNFKYTPYFQNDVFGFDENARVYQTCITNNAAGGFCENYRAGKSLEQTKFDHFTWSAGADYQIIPHTLTARYKIGTGFLAPTGTQIYRNFQGLGVMEVPNYKLKAETSLNQELEFEFKPTANTQFTVAGYLSDYKDFIHTRFWEGETGGCNGRAICLQSTNLDKAKVYGLKVGAKADLSEKLALDGQFSVSANYHMAKDSATVQTDHDGTFKINTLAATPTSFILGADYVSANQDWEIHGRVRGVLRKKASETKGIAVSPKFEVTTRECPYIGFEYYCSFDGYTLNRETGKYTKEDRVRTGYTESVDTYKHADRSKSVFIYDLYGSKRFGAKQQLTVNAGIYNIFDEKYIPWETLRMFSNANVNNMVDADGIGFARYTAPGRNYSLSVEYKF